MTDFNILNNAIDSISNPSFSTFQKEQYKTYFRMLLETNELYNLTAITDERKVVSHHLFDALSVVSYVNMQNIQTLCDIGTGAGIPGIPLKIYAPHITLILIEVNKKKILFLERVIKELDLEHVILYTEDWRTFLRKTHFNVNLFVSRASLHPDELLRIFKPSSLYKDATLIYFASKEWQPTTEERLYIYDQKTYTIENKARTLVFFKNKPV